MSYHGSTYGPLPANTSPMTSSQPAPATQASRETGRRSHTHDTGSGRSNTLASYQSYVHGSMSDSPVASGQAPSQSTGSSPQQGHNLDSASSIAQISRLSTYGPPAVNLSSMASDQPARAYRDSGSRSDTGSARTDSLASYQPYVQGPPASGSRMTSSQAPSQSAGNRLQQSSNPDSGGPITETVYRTPPYGSPSANPSSTASDQITPASRDMSSRLQPVYVMGPARTTQTSYQSSGHRSTNFQTGSGQSPSQSTGNRSQQGPDLESGRPIAQTSYHAGGHGPPPASIPPMVSEQPTLASQDTGSRPQQGHDTGSARKNTRVSYQPSGSQMVSSQALSLSAGNRSQQGSDLDFGRPINQTSYHSSAHGPASANISSVASNQTTSSRDLDSRSQQGQSLGSTTSTGQNFYPFFPSGSFVNNSPNSQAPRGTGSQQIRDKSPNQTFFLGPHAGFPAASSQPPQVLRSTSSRPQQERDVGSTTTGPSGLSVHNSPIAFNYPPASLATGSQQAYNMISPDSEPPINRPSEAPPGLDLTGKIKVLDYPGQEYRWMIGNGAFTDVFRGELRAGPVGATPTLVAVKLFRATPGDESAVIEATRRRLLRESSVWLRLKHPNIQPYLGHCCGLGPSIALVSPLCEHGSIAKYIAKYPTANKVQLVKDIAKGLEYLHSEEVIHADLHCNNILVDVKGYALLADFGRARVIGEAGYSTALVAGSAVYMAPELFPTHEPEPNVDELFSKRSDVYAFAMVCFEIFANEGPFASYRKGHLDWQVIPLICEGKRPKYTPRVQGLISRDMWNIMEDCWKQKPEKRISARVIVQRIDIS